MIQSAYAISGLGRMCAVTGREFRPGEKIHCVVLDQSGRYIRKDFSHEAWQGKPADAIAYWEMQVPGMNRPKAVRFSESDLVDCFAELNRQPDPDREPFRYVLALLLLRKKRLTLEKTHQDGEKTWLRMRDVKTDERVEIVDLKLTHEEIEAVQREIDALLAEG
jgi:hypothetical protein